MSHQKAVLLEIADALNAGGDLRIDAWFTDNFMLHDPGLQGWPSGHRGAGALLTENVKRGQKFEALDMIEQDDRVAVRWRLTETKGGKIVDRAVMSIYRFEHGRIAEDWGISSQAGWPAAGRE